MNNFERLFIEFKKGWDVRVIENDHLLKICFMEFLSTINRVKYIYGGQYKTVNLSSFKIQQSGTGKGVGDKYVFDLLRYMGYKVCKINTFTEAAMVGSLTNDVRGQPVILKGALGEYDFIWIDEGRNLIIGNNWSQGLLECVNGYLDDGWIFKRLARGEIKYYSNCNFATGSFFFDKLKPTVLTTGLFQRSLFSYKHYNHDDIMRISKKFDSLAGKNYTHDLKPVFEKIKLMKEELDFRKYNISKTDNPNYVVRMDIKAAQKLGELVDDYFDKEIFEQVADERLRNILTSFLIRSKELGHRIMCLYAVINRKNFIDEECADFAFPFIQRHLRYILEFISDTFEGKNFDTDDLNSEKIKNNNITKTKRAILKVVKDNPGITKSEFRTYLQKNRHLFNLGELKIIKETLPNLIAIDKIKIEQGNTAAEKRLYLNEIE